MAKFNIKPIGDRALRVRFNEDVSPKLNTKIQTFCKQVEGSEMDGVREAVPAYKTVTIYYQPDIVSYELLREKIKAVSLKKAKRAKKCRLILVPTLYGSEAGPDLAKVAEKNNLTTEQVTEIHAEKNYFIYMMGFLPGFPYLYKVAERIATPRLSNPRGNVSAGSVGIAGRQTGIYPLESPGGWNIIGRTPLKLFNPTWQKPFVFKAGDKVRFAPISKNEYDDIDKKVKNNNYKIHRKITES